MMIPFDDSLNNIPPPAGAWPRCALQICKDGNRSRICGGQASGGLSEIGAHQDWEVPAFGRGSLQKPTVCEKFSPRSRASNQGLELGGDQSEGPVKEAGDAERPTTRASTPVQPGNDSALSIKDDESTTEARKTSAPEVPDPDWNQGVADRWLKISEVSGGRFS